MKLERINAACLYKLPDQYIVRLDDDSYFRDVARNARCQLRQLVSFNMTRAFSEMHKADMAGASAQSGIECFGRGQAADFGSDSGHDCVLDGFACGASLLLHPVSCKNVLLETE